MPGASAGSFDWSPSTDWPGVTSSRLVPSRSSRPSRSARLDAEMPSTATIAAMPMAIPSAVSTAAALAGPEPGQADGGDVDRAQAARSLARRATPLGGDGPIGGRTLALQTAVADRDAARERTRRARGRG